MMVLPPYINKSYIHWMSHFNGSQNLNCTLFEKRVSDRTCPISRGTSRVADLIQVDAPSSLQSSLYFSK